MQRLLASLGHNVGAVDGIVGSGTRAAIRAFQKAEVLPEDGHPSQALLVRLKTAGRSGAAMTTATVPRADRDVLDGSAEIGTYAHDSPTTSAAGPG